MGFVLCLGESSAWRCRSKEWRHLYHFCFPFAANRSVCWRTSPEWRVCRAECCSLCSTSFLFYSALILLCFAIFVLLFCSSALYLLSLFRLFFAAFLLCSALVSIALFSCCFAPRFEFILASLLFFFLLFCSFDTLFSGKRTQWNFLQERYIL
jgi:hypothetical protein